MFFNHPGFVEANVDRVRAAMSELGTDDVHIAFTAHSIPFAMATNCAYEAQLRRGGATRRRRRSASRTGRSSTRAEAGSPQVPWLEPDIVDHLRDGARAGRRTVVISPLGFVSDHLEVLYDLDVEAREIADELGLRDGARRHGRHASGVRRGSRAT